MADVVLAFLCLFVAEVRLAFLCSAPHFSLMVALMELLLSLFFRHRN